MTSIAVCGIRGRMGGTLARLIASASDLELRLGIDREPAEGLAAHEHGCPRIVTPADSAQALDGVDVVIDFSAPDALGALIDGAGASLEGRALVVGTTGLDEAVASRLDELSQRAAVLTAANFSIGVNLLVALAERVAAVLDEAAYDVEIVESHHNRKADAPSGTALALGEAVSRGRGRRLGDVRQDGRSGATGQRPHGEIGLHAVRGGGVIGDHSVMFIGSRERIELNHHALDRALFAEGALTAARWLAGRTAGRYGMAEVLGLERDSGG